MNLTASILCSARSISLKLVAPRQIVFIDRNITDYLMLTAGVLPGITTVLVNLDSNGIDQITQALARHQDLTAIHIISHGAPGSVQLGNGYVNLDNLAEYTDRLRSWSRSLAADAEILLYGCEVAQGGKGASLVSWLGELTQSRVIAKATKTGNPALGGDWNLATLVPLAFTAEVMADYQGILADIPGTSGDDNLTGTAGNDTITGLGGNDNLAGGDGNDNISGGAGIDIITGGIGDDLLSSGTSDAGFGSFDNVDGGADIDTLVVDYSAKTYVAGIVTEAQNFTNGTGGFHAQVNAAGIYDRVRYANIEKFNITGTNQDDNISSGNQNDVLIGGAGDDILDGNAGVDTIDGGIGNDTAGADVSSTTIATNINLANPTNTLANGTQFTNIEAVNIKLGSAADTIIAGNFKDTVDGGAGDDIIDVKDGVNTVIGGAGNDTITSGRGADNLAGGDGNDNISGGAGIDIITGGIGDDLLSSGTSDAGFGSFDNVDGGADIDTLVVDYSAKTYVAGIVTEAQNFTNGTGGFHAQVNAAGIYDRVRYANIEKFNITGTNQDDNISGGNQNDVLIGGKGNDILDGNAGVDTIDGGDGNDTAGADIATTTAASNIDLSNAVNTLANGTKFTNIEAVDLKLGAGNDKIIAGNFKDTVDGGAGDDTIEVKDGVNTVIGGAGNDTITSGSGADNLAGSDGNDNISGGAGIDIITGGIGDDLLSSGTSDAGFGSFDNVDGGADIDTLVVDYSAKTYVAGIVTEAQNFTNGTGGFHAQATAAGIYDRVRYANIERFNITGTNKDDNISGGNQNDVLIGGAGDDILDGNAGVDTIDGGIGNDTAGADIATTAAASNIDLANTTNTLANGTQFINIEAVDLKLGGGNDKIIAGNFKDTVDAGAGDDNIDVKDGINTVIGGTGNDTITSGSGADNLAGGDGNDNIIGGGGIDIITGGIGDDVLSSGTSDAGFGSFDNVDGGADIDTLVVDYSAKTYVAGIVTEAQNFTNGTGGFHAQATAAGIYDRVRYANIERFNITGTNLADNISGGNQNDVLIGGKGNDIINGNAGNDTIIGVNTNDTNPGNAEIDTLTGGADNDIFVLSANGKDFYATSGNGDYAKITDFSLTQDVIQLRGAATDYSVTATTIGGVTAPGTALFRGSELIAVLQGVDSSSVNLTSTAFSYTEFTVLNDLPPIVSITNATPIAEGNSGTSIADFTVKLSNPTTKTVTVPYSTADGTATTGDSDYLGTATGSLTFLPGETSKNISVVINGDINIEADETFAVTLGAPTNGTLGTTATATGTIISDDSTVTISSTTNPAEGDTPGQFTLTRAGVIANALTVPYTLTGTATNGSDYNLPLSATFAAGSATAVVNLTAIDDTLFEGTIPETVIINLTAGTNYNLGATPTATINITDNDNLPTVSVSNLTIGEGTTGNSNAGFIVTLSNPTTETVTVDYSTVDGTAIAGSDYTAGTGTVTFTPGQTSQTVNIPVIGDLNFEANETFSLNLANPTKATLGTATGIGTINNDDLPTISVAVTDAEAAETLTGQPTNLGEFTFTRAGGETVEKTFLYTLSGTATNGSDYSIPGSVTFAAGSTTAKVSINPTDDNLFETGTPETAILTLIDDSYFQFGFFADRRFDRAATYRVDPTNNTGTISIADNDSRPTISIADTSKAEGNTGTSNMPFTVTLSNPTIETVTVDYATANGTATSDGADYTETNNTISFAPGEISKTINVPVLGDQIGEDDETYSVNLTNAVRGTIAKATGTGTILNDESGIAVSISDGDAGEANNNGQFLLTRSGELTNPVTVNYTLSGTATAGSDYQALSGSAVFAANQATVSIDLTLIDDTIFEGVAPETVTLTVTPSTSYVVSSANLGTIDLTDNDSRPVISVSNATIAEGNTGISKAPFTVSLSNASTETVTVKLSTADGTATTANNDYQALIDRTITFTPGQTSQIVDVDISGDLSFEANETFSSVLSNPTNGVISSTASNGIGTINNDDLPTISVAVTDAEAAETLTGQPTNLGEFTFTRVGGETVEKTFLYNISGTANGSDYSIPGSVTFAAGSTTAKVALNPTDDNLFEGAIPETVILTLKDDSVSSPTNFFVASDNRPATYRVDPTNNIGTISIADNDLRPTISIADTSVTEGNTGTNNAAFTITLSNPSTETVTVKYTAANGTATTDGNDYTSTTGTVTFTPGQISQIVTVPITGDLSIEGDETFTVTLSDAVSATGITRATATGTILDNDNGINVGVANPNIIEGATGVYTLTRTGDLSAAIDIAYTLSGTATSSDYQAVAGVATFAAGANTTLVNLTTIDDSIFEGETAESVMLTLTPSTNYLLGNSNASTISVADNDLRPVISIGNAAITEGNTGTSNAGFTVSLSNASVETVSVNLSTTDGTATTANSDYQAVTNQAVTFAPGQTSQVVNVAVNGDLSFEANETFGAGLSTPTNGVISATAGNGTGTINNDDLPTISVAVSDAEATETVAGQPANPGEFTFTRSGITTDAKTVLFSMSGTAGGADYTIPGSVTFAAGSNTATVSLSAIDDNIFEGATPETAILTLRDDRIISFDGILGNDRPPTYLVDVTNNTSTVNITDNDSRPTVAISSLSQAEGSSGTTNFGFNVSLSNPTVETVAVDYSTADGTATVAGTATLDPDYTAKAGTVTFTPEQTSQSINIAVNGDRDFEADQTFTVNLTNPQNTSGITTATGTGTITNDDTLPSITVAATNPISTEGVGEGLFTFYRTGGNLDRSLTIDFDVLGNATSRQGYGSQTGSITFAAGSNTATLPVPVANNSVYSAFRGCIIQLRSGTGYSIGGGGSGGGGGGAGGSGGSGGAGGGLGGSTATVTIVDDDTAPVISINDVSVTEGNDGTQDLTFTVSLNNASDDVVKVDYASADGTATAGSDYLATTGTLNFTPSDIIAGTTEFTPGETSKTITVKINGDAEIESNEAFTLNLTNAVGGTIGKATGTGTITNDDLPKVPVVAPEVIIPAPIVPTPDVIASPAVVIPTPIEIVQTPVVVAPEVITPAPIVPTPEVIASPAVVPPTPVEIVPTPVVVAPEVITPAPIVPTPEVIVVPDVVISAPVLPIITIVATNPTSTEGIGEGLFTFSRTGGDLNIILTIDFDLSGNATTRQGYGTRTGSVTFAAGSNTATLGVPVADNAVYNSARSCVVTLRKGSGYDFDETIGTAKVNIIDDEQAPVISIDDVSITEGNQGTQDLTFTVALSNTSDDIVKVDYASIDGEAIAGRDYLAINGSLEFSPADIIAGTTKFAPGETSKTITVKINGDTEIDGNETFCVNLTNAVGGTLGKEIGIGTIINDDSPDIDITETIKEQIPVVVEDPNPIIPIDNINPEIVEQPSVVTEDPNPIIPVDNINPEIIEQPPVIVDPKPITPINNTNPDFISNNKQLLGSSLQNIAQIIDLQSVSNNTTVQATFSVQRSAGYDNHVSFYKIEDAQGTIITPTGITLKPGDAGYLTAAIQNRLTNIDLLGVNGQTVTSRSNVQGGAIYAPLIIANDKPDSVNLNFSNVYTAYSAANADKIEHIRLLGDNTFGFEDMNDGGDKDFNDTIVQANFSIATNSQDLVLNVVKLTPTSTAVNLNLTSYTGQTLKADITTTSNAAYSNNIGFYAVEDELGTIKLNDGSFVNPGDASYAVEAIKNALANSLQAGKSDTKTDLNITGGKIYAPVVVAQGTLNDFIAKNPTNGGGANDIHAYFNYIGANSDKTNHFRLIGDNTFGVEDMYGGGDRDFNDLVVNLKIKSL